MSAALSVTLETRPETIQLVRHLRWHKAMAQDDDDGKRISEMLELVAKSQAGEHVSIKDPFHRDIALAFELVIQNHLDPWAIDLVKFSDMYLRAAKERGVELVTAGRILCMAWSILRLQAEAVATRFLTVPEEMASPGWDDIADLSLDDAEFAYTQRVLAMPLAPIDEKIRHKGDRRVTLMELMQAFQQAHVEGESRKVLVQQRLEARLSLSRRMRGHLGGSLLRDNLREDMQETLARLQEAGVPKVPFTLLHERTSADLVQTFNSLLFLVKEGHVDVEQPEFPRGEIFVSLLMEGSASPEKTEATA